MSIRSSLLDAGFVFQGLCPVCSGRGWDYRLDGLKATIKTDGNNNEIVVTIDGLYNGIRIMNKVAIPQTIDQLLEEIGLKQPTTINGN